MSESDYAALVPGALDVDKQLLVIMSCEQGTLSCNDGKTSCASGEILWVIQEGRLPRFRVRLSTRLH